MTREIDVQKIFLIDWIPVKAGGMEFIPDHRIFRPRYTPQGVKIVVEKPRFSPAWLKADKPWEDFILGAYLTVTYEEGRHRLWYESYDSSYYENVPMGDFTAKLCYAESENGTDWNKPQLGIVTHQGSKTNNIVYDTSIAGPYAYHGGTVFRDPGALADERYKLIYMAWMESDTPKYAVRGATSPDGLHWKPIEKPLIEDYVSDSQTTCYYDEELNCYVGYFRLWDQGRRTIARATTTNFRKWPRPEIVLALGGPHEHPSHDLYTNAHIKYSKDVHLMFPAQYNREIDTMAVHLAISRDGIRWHYFGEEPIIALEEGAGSIYAGCGLVPVGEKSIALPYAVYPTTHNHFPLPTPYMGEYRWAIWKRDRLVALCAHARGEFSLQPLIHRQNRLLLNLQTEQVGEVYVQLSDEEGNTIIKGYSFENCDPIRGDHPEVAVTWRGNPDMPQTAGKPITITFRMYAARIYTIQV